ncbi:hypothetical protein G6F36_000825 [Rhizopus arrhizus]|nr:hypothetical protein G6F36_000825 [Rhizopus arrhizus]
MSSFPLELTLQENNRSYNFYLDNSKLIKPTISTSESFSEEESDSTNSTKSSHHQAQKHLKKREVNSNMKKEEMDSDNDSLIEYTKNTKKNKKMIENEKKQKNLYKTELCRNWEETGQCRYGTKCQYAHGAQDLREIERHPKYKTQKCRTFHKTGSCPYGARCTFRHFSLPGDDEEHAAATTPMLFGKEKFFPRMNSEKIFQPNWYSSTPFTSTSMTEQYKRPFMYDSEDALLPSNAESLLPHQLLFDLDNEQLNPIPNYYQQDTLCKSFFRPWLI